MNNHISSLNRCNIAERFNYIRCKIAAGVDAQKLVILGDNATYLSPLDAFKIVCSLKSLDMTISSNAFHFTIDIFQDVTFRKQHQRENWALLTLESRFNLTEYFDNLYHKEHFDYNDIENVCAHDFIFLFFMLKRHLIQLRKERKLMADTKFQIPSLTALTCESLTNSFITNRTTNNFFKTLINYEGNRKLGEPIGDLSHLPWIDIEKLWYKTPISIKIDFDSLQCDPVEFLQFRQRSCYVCFVRLLNSLPYICHHKCSTCTALCTCPPCTLCLSGRDEIEWEPLAIEEEETYTEAYNSDFLYTPPFFTVTPAGLVWPHWQDWEDFY